MFTCYSGTSQDLDKTVLIAGDYCGSSNYSRHSFSRTLTQLITESELAIVNLEAPIGGHQPRPKNGPTLNQTQDDVTIISDLGFDVVTLANNHTMDFGSEGLTETLRVCDDRRLQTVGAGHSQEEAATPIEYQMEDSTIGIFNLCAKEFGIADQDQSGVAWINQPGITNRINNHSDEVDILLIIVHGGLEHVPYPPRSWQSRLRSLIDSGADAVIGHHPHVAQGWEIYDGNPIVYSLGNFAFRMDNKPKTHWGYLLGIQIKEGRINNCKIYLIRNQPEVELIPEAETDSYWDHLLRLSEIQETYYNNPGYWQEIATYLFKHKYQRVLTNYGNGHLMSLLQTPKRELDYLTKGIIDPKEVNRQKDLKMLNYLQASQHRHVMETALRLQTNVIQDERSPETKEEVERALSWTDHTFNESMWRAWKRRYDIVKDRLH